MVRPKIPTTTHTEDGQSSEMQPSRFAITNITTAHTCHDHQSPNGPRSERRPCKKRPRSETPIQLAAQSSRDRHGPNQDQ